MEELSLSTRTDFLKSCEEAARLGGQVLLEMQGRILAREKGPSDLVTEADLASQEVIQRFLLNRFPTHRFVGEESSVAELQAARVGMDGNSPEYTWIVDPLDGTTNYVHGLNYFSVSVALMRRGQLVVGAVFDPVSQTCFSAVYRGGATCNGRPLAVGQVTQLDQALVAASFPARVSRGSHELRRFAEVLYRAQGVRRLGSAALNLCLVADGKLDGYWATSVKLWDIAAGVLILLEAGGVIRQLDGKPLNVDRPCFAAAGQPQLLDELLTTLNLGERRGSD